MEECDCRDPTEWTLVLDDSLPDNACVVADNGAVTITLPPSSCEYLSPDEVYLIIDGLPPGTTIEFDVKWNEKWIYLGEDGRSIERVVLWNRYDLVGIFKLKPDGSAEPEPL